MNTRRHLIARGALAALTLTAALLAGCGSGGASPAPAQTTTPAASACESALHQMYVSLGGAQFGPGRFAAAVNAESFAGTLPRACDTLTHSRLMAVAATVSH
jgi:hypothetical protein